MNKKPSPQSNVNNLSSIVLMVFNRMMFFSAWERAVGSNGNDRMRNHLIDFLDQFFLLPFGIGYQHHNDIFFQLRYYRININLVLILVILARFPHGSPESSGKLNY